MIVCDINLCVFVLYAVVGSMLCCGSSHYTGSCGDYTGSCGVMVTCVTSSFPANCAVWWRCVVKPCCVLLCDQMLSHVVRGVVCIACMCSKLPGHLAI